MHFVWHNMYVCTCCLSDAFSLLCEMGTQCLLLYLNTLSKQCWLLLRWGDAYSIARALSAKRIRPCVKTPRPHPAHISSQQLISALIGHDWRAGFVSWWSSLPQIRWGMMYFIWMAYLSFIFYYRIAWCTVRCAKVWLLYIIVFSQFSPTDRPQVK